MARYIDADALIKQMKDGKYVDRETSFQRGVNSAIDYWITEINHFPTADVVPKSEVAREIFEEIDELLVQNATMQIATSTLHCKLAELKKKYTESEK